MVVYGSYLIVNVPLLLRHACSDLGNVRDAGGAGDGEDALSQTVKLGTDAYLNRKPWYSWRRC